MLFPMSSSCCIFHHYHAMLLQSPALFRSVGAERFGSATNLGYHINTIANKTAKLFEKKKTRKTLRRHDTRAGFLGLRARTVRVQCGIGRLQLGCIACSMCLPLLGNRVFYLIVYEKTAEQKLQMAICLPGCTPISGY